MLAINNGGPRETVLDKKTGFLLENTVSEWSDSLETLIENNQLYEEMSRNCKERVHQHFSFKRFQALLADILAEHKLV